MLKTDGNCPHCGKKLMNYDEREWKYGSPIQVCKKCGKRYIDGRYHEIVIEGIAPDAMSVKKDLVYIAVLFVIAVASVGINFISIILTGKYSLKLAFLPVICLIGLVFMLIDIIRIKTGAKERRFKVLREESYQRLKNKTYAYELSEAGYNVPQEYL